MGYTLGNVRTATSEAEKSFEAELLSETLRPTQESIYSADQKELIHKENVPDAVSSAVTNAREVLSRAVEEANLNAGTFDKVQPLCKVAQHFFNERAAAAVSPDYSMLHLEGAAVNEGIAKAYDVCEAYFARYHNPTNRAKMALPLLTHLLAAMAQRAGEKELPAFLDKETDALKVYLTHDAMISYVRQALESSWKAPTGGVPNSVPYNTHITLEMTKGHPGGEFEVRAWVFLPTMAELNAGLKPFPEGGLKRTPIDVYGSISVAWPEFKSKLSNFIKEQLKFEGAYLSEDMRTFVNGHGSRFLMFSFPSLVLMLTC